MTVTEVLRLPSRGDVAGAVPLCSDGERLFEATALATGGTVPEVSAALARFAEQLCPLIQLRKLPGA